MSDAQAGFTLWFTGLPCAGKSTLAQRMAGHFQSQGRRVELLDGDIVRTNLSKGLGFSKADRDTNILRIGFVAQLLTRNDVIAIVAAVSPYAEARQACRRMIGRFVEVYVRCPLEVCMQRDRKGMYRRALAGEISQFTGISDPYEAPTDPEITVDSDQLSEGESADLIVRRLVALGYIRQHRLGPVDVTPSARLMKRQVSGP